MFAAIRQGVEWTLALLHLGHARVLLPAAEAVRRHGDLPARITSAGPNIFIGDAWAHFAIVELAGSDGENGVPVNFENSHEIFAAGVALSA